MNDTDLAQFDLNTLVQHGRQALRDKRFGQAARLLREAARRAPFRQDVREWMAQAMEQAARQGELPAKQPRREAARPAPAPAAAPERYEEDAEAAEAEGIEFREQRRAAAPAARPVPAANTMHSNMRAGAVFQSGGVAGRGAAAAVRGARGFSGERNPARAAQGAVMREPRVAPRSASPLGPMLWGMLFGLLALGVIGGGGWYFLQHQAEVHERERLLAIKQTLDRARDYKAQGNFVLVLEQLNHLQPSPERDAALTEFYRDKGNASLAQQPPDYAGAIQEYANGLKIAPKSTELGMLLGRGYYQLATEQLQRDRTASDTNLKNARTAFEALLELDPNSVDALNYLARIAILQHDPVLQQECYRNIIKIDPQSAAADAARRNLQSAGMKL